MKIQEMLEARKKNLPMPVDDFDDSDPAPEDPESDKIPHIVMQLRKALDVDGDYPVTFRDGKKVKIPLEITHRFLEKYLSLKPADREAMQNLASASVEGFKAALKGEGERAQKSIYAYK